MSFSAITCTKQIHIFAMVLYFLPIIFLYFIFFLQRTPLPCCRRSVYIRVTCSLPPFPLPSSIRPLCRELSFCCWFLSTPGPSWHREPVLASCPWQCLYWRPLWVWLESSLSYIFQTIVFKENWPRPLFSTNLNLKLFLKMQCKTVMKLKVFQYIFTPRCNHVKKNHIHAHQSVV